MTIIPDHFKLNTTPIANGEAMVYCGAVRFTVLTERLIRIEYHPEKQFEDRASQSFWYREQPTPLFTVRQDSQIVEIETDALHLIYDASIGDGLTPKNLKITVKGTDTSWTPETVDEHNLYGTTRTLDFINGYVPLHQGLISRSGWAIVDDSQTLVFNDESWLVPREQGGIDWYFFGYGHDYKACLRDYCQVSGQMPLIPRWILGNWWSRFWHYTQDEMITLLDDFQKYQMPFSVCIVDMDWHITETGNQSSGWTGYTWNRDLFPNPQQLIQDMHDKNLKVSLNLHPAEGIHAHEEYYPEMARRMGIDPDSGEPVAFDITDPQFVNAYFEVLHHPHEEMGVDFWWLDWQQGLKSKIDGLDPLWLINHLHFYHQGKDGKRPFIFSRWGNQGHQRYPIGFSGDSYVTWETLGFQPYMTATASNIAYGWWSHDIGGHTSGIEDPELYIRWVQFGALSPINRIHVTKGEFYDRRPWMMDDENVVKSVREALQFRHALIPYLYTMAKRANDQALPLMLPMYYDYPEPEQAYHFPQQYLFGSELIAAPYVTPKDADTGLSRQVVWLPEGSTWYHFFTGERYEAGVHAVYGHLNDMPLFAKAGAIVPLADHGGEFGADNPSKIHVHIFAGADNQFMLYEDDGDSVNTTACITTFVQTWRDNRLDFTIDAPEGDVDLIPAERIFTLSVHGVRDGLTVDAIISQMPTALETVYDGETETLIIKNIMLSVNDGLTLSLIGETGKGILAGRDRTKETLHRYFKAFRLPSGMRAKIWDNIDAIINDPEMLTPYFVTMSQSQIAALCELFYQAGVHHIRDTHHPDLLLLWNNRDNSTITYRYGEIYLWFGQVPHNDYHNGEVPRFASIIPHVQSWRHGGYEENVQRTQWQLNLRYGQLTSIGYAHQEVTP